MNDRIEEKPVILCIDDDSSILLSLSQQLKKSFGKEYSIERCDNPLTAIEFITELIIEQVQIPIIICDQSMPGISGDELLTMIQPISPYSKKILLTGHATINEISKAINSANLFGFITKPYTEENLISTINKALDAYNQEKGLEEKTLELEKTLLIQELKFKNLIEQINGSLFTITAGSSPTYIYISPQIYNLTHFTPEEFTFELWKKRVHPEDRHKIFQRLDSLDNGIKHFNIEYRFYNKEDELIWLSDEVNIIYQSGHPLLLQGIRTDITNRKNDEAKLSAYSEELNKAHSKLLVLYEQAEKANKTKSMFIANISHEFKTPLNSILGYCQLMQLPVLGSLNEKQKEYLSMIAESGQHLLELVESILDFSRIEAGKIEITKTELNLSSLIKEAITSIMGLLAEKNITFELKAPSSDHYIFADRTRMKQVIINLLGNAVKFTPPGKKIGVSCDTAGDYHLLEIWDEGIGIPASELENIFEPFEQVRNDESVKNKGTGLGLAIVKTILNLHGFKLNVFSVENKGTVFTITMNTLPEPIDDELK